MSGQSRFDSACDDQIWTGCHSGEGGGFLTRVIGWVRFPPGPPIQIVCPCSHLVKAPLCRSGKAGSIPVTGAKFQGVA